LKPTQCCGVTQGCEGVVELSKDRRRGLVLAKDTVLSNNCRPCADHALMLPQGRRRLASCLCGEAVLEVSREVVLGRVLEPIGGKRPAGFARFLLKLTPWTFVAVPPAVIYQRQRPNFVASTVILCSTFRDAIKVLCSTLDSRQAQCVSQLVPVSRSLPPSCVQTMPAPLRPSHPPRPLYRNPHSPLVPNCTSAGSS
jgi:hypothetical protein